MITKSIRGNEPREQIKNLLGIIPYFYPIYKTRVYRSVSPPTTNEYDTYTIRFLPQLRMNTTHRHLYTIRFLPQLRMNTTNTYRQYSANNIIHIYVHTRVHAYVLNARSIPRVSCTFHKAITSAQGTHDFHTMNNISFYNGLIGSHLSLSINFDQKQHTKAQANHQD